MEPEERLPGIYYAEWDDVDLGTGAGDGAAERGAGDGGGFSSTGYRGDYGDADKEEAQQEEGGGSGREDAAAFKFAAALDDVGVAPVAPARFSD